MTRPANIPMLWAEETSNKNAVCIAANRGFSLTPHHLTTPGLK